MLSLESNKLVFSFNNAEKKMRFPTVREWVAYQVSIESAKNNSEIIEAGIEFFVKLGLDKKTAEILENDHLEKIMSALSGSKKK
jgi:hypothetical protein